MIMIIYNTNSKTKTNNRRNNPHRTKSSITPNKILQKTKTETHTQIKPKETKRTQNKNKTKMEMLLRLKMKCFIIVIQ